MSLGLLGVAMGVNFARGFLSGVQDSNTAAYSAADYAKQAEMLNQNAATVRLNGAINEDIMRSKNRAYISSGTAAANEAGMGESPTMMTYLSQANYLLEQNVLSERYKVESEAENYLYQARVMAHNAHKMRKKSGGAFRNGLINGISSAFGTLVSNIG